eukprot:13458136-Alexandrium_andersonii.AAC.1
MSVLVAPPVRPAVRLCGWQVRWRRAVARSRQPAGSGRGVSFGRTRSCCSARCRTLLRYSRCTPRSGWALTACFLLWLAVCGSGAQLVLHGGPLVAWSLVATLVLAASTALPLLHTLVLW